MKKILIALGIVAILVFLALGAGAIWMVRTSREVMRDIGTRQSALVATNADFPFTAPAGGTASERQLQTWIRVARRQRELGRARLEELASAPDRPSFGAAFKFGMSIMVNEVTDLEQALRSADVSLAEFSWIHHQVQAALQDQAALSRPAVAEIVRAIEARAPKSAWPTPPRDTATRNDTLDSQQVARLLDLIESHSEEFLAVAPDVFADVVLRQLIGTDGIIVPRPPTKPAP